MSVLVRSSICIALIAAIALYFKPDLVDETIALYRKLQPPIDTDAEDEDSKPPKDVEREINNKKLDDVLSNLKLKANRKCVPDKEMLFNKHELKIFDGRDKELPIYLAYLGVVYDVTRGQRHYGPGGSYSFFSGVDATRAFVTGQFNETGLVDDIDDLSVDSYSSLKEWSDLYEKDYIRIGRVSGYYYREDGCPTSKIDFFQEMLKKNEDHKAEEINFLKMYPPCNTEWNGESNVTRVWCTNLSGGVERDWVGVPRNVHFPDRSETRCACVPLSGIPNVEYSDDEGPNENPIVNEYEGCDPKSFECKFMNN